MAEAGQRPRANWAGFALAAVLALLGTAGCGSSTPSPSVQPLETPSAGETRSASPTLAPTPTPTPTPSPSPTPAPTFVPTGSMNQPRIYATATLLQNGQALIAGGSTQFSDSGISVLASAELYDPATHTFTPTGSMTIARTGATATLLPDGHVLIAGGISCGNPEACSLKELSGPGGGNLASAELYDPATGKFTRTGSMSRAAANTATLLPDGRVLMANGNDGSLTAEMYHPATGKFSRAGSLLNNYNSVNAVLLPTDKVLFAGPGGSPRAELYDPASGKFTRISIAYPPGVPASLRSSASSALQTATLLKDGRVLLCILDYFETYDPVSGSIMASGSMSGPGEWLEPTPTLLPDGRVLFAGGVLESPDHQAIGNAASAGLYDPVSGSFAPVGPMNSPRNDQTATLLPDGTVLIAGGTSDLGNAIASAELFVP